MSMKRSSTKNSNRPRRKPGLLPRILTIGTLIAFMAVAAAGPVSAHESEEGTEAFLFVRQAIALIVNTPDDHDAITDKVNDAIEAPDDHGVDIAFVEEARTALEAEDLQQTRSLLEHSIGAVPHLGLTDPVPAGEHVDGETEEETAVEPFLDPLDTSRNLSGSDWAVIAGALALVAIGSTAAASLRPAKVAKS